MAFLGDSGDDILVTERNNGDVKLVIDGEVQDEPLIDVEVANNNGTNERGLHGTAVIDATDETAAAAANSTETTTTYVFLYFTESGGGEDGDDDKGVVPTGTGYTGIPFDKRTKQQRYHNYGFTTITESAGYTRAAL